MKNKKILFIIFLAFIFASGSKAQFCNSFGMTKNMEIEYQNLNSKNKVTSKTRTTCVDVKTIGSGAVIYHVNTMVSDAKDNKLAFWEYEMECKDGKFYMSMGSFTDPELMKENDDLDIYVDTSGMEYPDKLSVGQTLPDASISISKAEIGVTMKTYTAKVTNRKVVGVESVTSPAGTFDCFKITYDLQVKGLLKKKYNVAEYLSEGLGKVKTENFDKKGKLKSSSILSELIR